MSASTATQQRMSELAWLVLGIRSAFAGISDMDRWQPATGSAAAADLEVYERLAGVQNPRIVLETICTHLELASAYAGGLAAVIEANEVMVSPWPLARGVLESCACATSVLGEPPPTGTALDRLAHAYNERLFSDGEAIERLKARNSGDAAPLVARRAQLHSETRTVFPGVTRDDMSSRRVTGIKRPNMIARMTW
ncbi:hypothetical protein IU474_25990 [Nocardia otitidiscaviarum]|uniref:hypothetical protein n=1 Tax=Nocardia otitidiscaviarum TaxID=1823 RepID=UPI001892EE0A|nr:hypothetical protein [Nocardia otitidiscaviarum]MBF6240500.1 hypothetical protein [Nocardia otitidiscaviarum]